jgi:hypothetical protein
MSKADKLLAKMRNHPLDWRIEDIRMVASAHGITERDAKGSHTYFFHVDMPEIKLSVPVKRPIKPVYVRQFIALIDQLEATK